VAAALGAAANAHASTFVVTRTDDPAPSACDSDCSLREAVRAVNAGSGGDTIQLAAGRYVLTIGGAGEDTAATGDLDLLKNVTISGAGAGATVIDASGTDRAFDVFTGVIATIGGVTITGGRVDADGGAIRNAGSLTLARDSITGNEALTATLRRGGGIFTTTGLTVTQSTIAGNRAYNGGAVAVMGTAAVTVDDSTIAGNLAGGPGSNGVGGGFVVAAGTTLAIRSSTISGNQSFNGAASGGGIFGISASLENTIVANNLSHEPNQSATRLDNCAVGTLTSNGHNLSDGTDCNLSGNGDRPGVDAKLGALGDHGGGTDTMAPLAGSPAIDAGAGCPPIDQRGLSRPRGSACEIGAYEVAPPVVATTPARAIGLNSVILAGTVDPSLQLTSFRFEFGTTTAYGSTSAVQWASPGASLVASAALTGLKAGTTYHYRIVATNADGTQAGSDMSFTTLDRTPPRLTLLRVSPGIFRAVKGAKILYTLSEAGTVTFKVDRVLTGVRVGRSCVAKTKRRKRGRPCTRYIPTKGTIVQTAKLGTNSLRFDTRRGPGTTRLAAGAYRLDAIPRDLAKNLGKTAVAAFRVRR